MDTLNDIWREVLEYVRPHVSQTGFNSWLLNSKSGYLEFKEFKNNTVYLHSDNMIKIQIASGQYAEMLRAGFEEVMGFPVELEFVLDETEKEEPTSAEPEEDNNIYPLPDDKKDQFTFETFVEGPSNRFAYRAAKAVAMMPTQNLSLNFVK